MERIRKLQRQKQNTGQQEKAEFPLRFLREKQLDKKIADQSLQKIGRKFTKLKYGIHRCLRKKPVMVSLTSFTWLWLTGSTDPSSITTDAPSIFLTW